MQNDKFKKNSNNYFFKATQINQVRVNPNTSARALIELSQIIFPIAPFILYENFCWLSSFFLCRVTLSNVWKQKHEGVQKYEPDDWQYNNIKKIIEIGILEWTNESIQAAIFPVYDSLVYFFSKPCNHLIDLVICTLLCFFAQLFPMRGSLFYTASNLYSTFYRSKRTEKWLARSNKGLRV